MKILFVDSKRNPQEQAYLECHGHEIEYADTLGSGYEKVKQKRYDAVIIDGSLNDQLGEQYTLSQRLHDEFPNIIRICYTAEVSRTYLDQFMEKFDAVVSRLRGVNELQIILETMGKTIKNSPEHIPRNKIKLPEIMNEV